MRTVLGVSVRVAVFWLAVRAFLVAPIVVQTSSMAPTLRGLHGRVLCPKCNREIIWGADLADLATADLVCVQCGATQHAVADRSLTGGDRLLVDRNAFLVRSPRRWDLAVLHDPEAPGRWLVKRIVGLPGETISIRQGDLFDGQTRIKKSLGQLQTLAIPVYSPIDETTASGQLALWRGDEGATQWERRVAGQGVMYLRTPATAAVTPVRTSSFDWLHFRSARKDAGPVSDALSYNQDRLRRPFPVSDLLLECRVRCQGTGALAVRLPSVRDVLLQWNPRAGVIEVIIDGQLRHTKNRPAGTGGDTTRFAVAHCDGRLLAEIGGNSFEFDVAELRQATIDGKAASRTDAPAIGARDLGVEISDLRLARDIYYAPPGELPKAPWDHVRLGADELLLLGDNPAVSRDSRYWRPAAVNGNSLLGRPFLMHGTSRPWRFGTWVFQVPDFERIRYISTVADE